MSDDSIVVLHCPGQRLHDEVDNLPLMDDVVMVPLSDALVSMEPDVVVTDQDDPILGPSISVAPGDQPQQSVGSMGHIGERDVLDECGDDVEVFYPSLYLNAMPYGILTCTVNVVLEFVYNPLS